jgi:hypothetical protein
MVQMIAARKSISDLGPKQLKLRAPLYHKDFPFIIFWSQKSACTPIVRWFFMQLGLLEKGTMDGVRVHAFEKTFKSRLNYRDELFEELKAGTKPAIKFVRDPYARAYSSYLEISSKGVLHESYWGKKVRTQIISDLAGGAPSVEYTFSFLQYLKWLLVQDVKTQNNHIRPQHLARDNHISMRLVRIESLEENMKQLEQEFSLPHSVASRSDVLQSSHFHKKSQTIDKDTARGLLEFGVPVRRSPDFPHIKFDTELAKGTIYEGLVKKCFPQDIKLYGY